jgi:hypothetical protein
MRVPGRATMPDGYLAASFPERRMNKYEYKVLMVPYKTSVFQSDNTEIQEVLNAAGDEHWRLSQLVLPSTVWGRSNTMIAILERTKA